MEFRNLPTERMDVAVPIMRATASLSGTQQPVFHLSINWAPAEPVNRELMHAVMVQTVSDLGRREHQAVIVEHINTDHPHVHAMVNRVNPETGVAWKGSWSKFRAGVSLRRQEVEWGLRVVPGWLVPVPGAPELRPQPRLARGDEEFLREVQERAGPVLARAQSWSELKGGLSGFGLSVRVNGRGMSVTDGRREVKASQVGPEFSRGKLEKRLRRYSDYSARVAVSAAAVRSHADASGNIGIPKDGADSEHRPLTLAEGVARAFDPMRGAYPAATKHARDAKKYAEKAVALLGRRLTWAELTPGTMLYLVLLVLSGADRGGRAAARAVVLRAPQAGDGLGARVRAGRARPEPAHGTHR